MIQLYDTIKRTKQLLIIGIGSLVISCTQLTPKDYTVLFVIKGNSYPEFMSKVIEIDSVDNHYYVIMDSTSQFLRNNNKIPFRILYRSVMIDKDNKIKLIGAPYRSTQMTKLFYQACGFSPND